MARINVRGVAPEMAPVESMKDIIWWVESMPPEMHKALYEAVGITWNYCADLIDAHNEFGGDAVDNGE